MNSLRKLYQRFNQNIALDMGTGNIRMQVLGHSQMREEPNMIALPTTHSQRVVIGTEAKDLVGRTAENFQIHTPMQHGVLAEYESTRRLLTELFQQSLKQAFIFRPTVMVALPHDATQIERNALQRVIVQAGAKRVYLIDQPFVAAVGAGVPVADSSGNVVVHLGAGICEAVILSMGGIVFAQSQRYGGTAIDRVIATFIQRAHGVQISDQTAEQLKKTIGLDQELKQKVLVRGSDVVYGKPKQIHINPVEIAQVVLSEIGQIEQFMQQLLLSIPAELSSDVLDKGILLTGGLSQMKGLDQYLSQQLEIPVTVAEDAEHCVTNGLRIVLQQLDGYKESIQA